MIFLRALFFGLAFALLPACGVQGTVDERVDAARERNDGPAIWTVKDHDSTLYLFGTVHLLPPDITWLRDCLLYTSPSPRDRTRSRMPSSA